MRRLTHFSAIFASDGIAQSRAPAREHESCDLIGPIK
jgi:hypothetical protein